jgi:hypothetical protein
LTTHVVLRVAVFLSSFKDQLLTSLVSNYNVKKRSQELSVTLFKVTLALAQKVSVTNLIVIN